jgi:hypothetical protein
MIDISKALLALRPGAVWTLDGNVYEGITWLDTEQTIPTKEEVEAWIDPNIYKYKRASEYPSFEDQFDLIYHNGIDAWKAIIQAVKDKYPKA